MASLQISGGSVRFVVGFNRTSYNRPIGSVTFPHSPRRFSIGRPLLLRRASVSGESETDEITDAERDVSGSSSASLLGFQLAPPGDQEIISANTTKETTHQEETSDATDESEMADFGVPGNRAVEEGPAEVEYTSVKAEVINNLVFVTSEAAPYSKTGGLGDVCGSLPIALAGRGHRVMVISPRYLNGTSADKNYARAKDLGVRVTVHCFGGSQEVSFYHEYRDGVDWVFIDHQSYHRPGNPYGDSKGAFGDNQFRFTLLCHAACEAPLVLPLGGFTYGEKSLFLVNDWHAGLVPILLAAKYRPYGVYKDARSILIIHNLAHQGVEPAATYSNLGLPSEWYGAVGWVFPTWARTHALDTGEAVNVLKGAIVTSDRIITVSQGYAWEITTVEGGYGLQDLLSSRKSVINGITNGINIDEWDPSKDEHIPFHYSLDDYSNKVKCKMALQKELGLPIRPECPMVWFHKRSIGFIGRLDYQKGIDLIQTAGPDLMVDDIQFVMLGSGDPKCESWMRSMEETYRDKFRGWVGFNVPISHRITAGCDILLMPSRFEPCGLNQLYAMRYGTIPVVHATGGLRDTVENFNPYAEGGAGAGTGWVFSPLSKDSMVSALRLAAATYREYKDSWEGLMRRGMSRNYSWENAAVQYEQVFQWVFMDPPYIN
ncbi:hypothetical protein IGI04_024302 [Brassica rapa subsp. trilocularis]|uniref:Starch synthase, chloroplastic/amyloplastic n=1 Tax=Brassica rapa subsp. trilocularis TaxID=1813537 RepID=A0ABQ7M6B5_BRACM|nr:hypothetical protein IGI04_024302 [Brassica rapa subsp. trilocularis]